ncbi:MAG TPA: cyclase family protein [Gemmatimonadales bacterium]|nr:cyclase family protein [Gemmatimonadales bacterium]
MRRPLLLGLVAISPMLVACPSEREPAPPGRPSIADARWIDLTHPFDSTTIYWPTAQPFRLEVVSAERTPAGYYYAANNFGAAEHGGTHLDAPIHFAEGRHTTDEIPLDRLIGPALVVDVAGAAARNADYRVTAEDLVEWEREHGTVPEGAIVLIRTGWARRWPDRSRYLGTARLGPRAVDELHFPGLDSSAARLLVARRVDAVGIDTPSVDHGQSRLFESHRILSEANVPAFENVANLESLPVLGATVVALPMKIAGGSGGPLRIVAMVPE